MALVKLSFVVGAGLIGSVLTSSGGGLSDIRNVFTGVFQVITKIAKQEGGNSGSNGQPPTKILLEQINKIRDELQRAKSSERLIIVSGSGSGYSGLGVKAVVIVGVTGYIVLWWKGWKLSSFMFVTRRGFSDAVKEVAKQMNNVTSSIADAKRLLTSRIDRVDTNLEECKEITLATKDEVSKMHGDLSSFQNEVESVNRAFQTLETKLSRIEGNQEFVTRGVYHLTQFVERYADGRNREFAQGLPSSSEGAPGLPPVASVVSRALPSSSQVPPGLPLAVPLVSRAISLPPLSLEEASPLPASPSAVTPKVRLPLVGASPSGLKDISSFGNIESLRSPFASGFSAEATRENSGESKNDASSNGKVGWFSKLYRSSSTQ